MHKWLIVAMLMLGVVLTAAAQNTAPLRSVANLEADASSLAIIADGERLVAGITGENQAQIYDLADIANPHPLNTITFDGAPDVMTGAGDFALVAVAAEDADLLQLVARPSYNPRQGYINYATYDLISQPEDMAVSPSSRWAVIFGGNGYSLLELLSADEIGSTTVDGQAIRGAALTNNTLLLLPEASETIEVTSLGRGAQLGRTREFALDEIGVDVAVNSRGTVGAVLLEDDTITLFNPAALETFSTFSVPASFDTTTFLTSENGEWLVLSQQGQDSLFLIDVSNPEAIAELGAFSLDAPLEALTIYSELLVISDGQSITFYTPA